MVKRLIAPDVVAERLNYWQEHVLFCRVPLGRQAIQSKIAQLHERLTELELVVADKKKGGKKRAKANVSG